MSWERMTAMGPAGENRWSRWRRLLVPSLFFAGVIYYEELFLKLFCFHAVTPVGALFTLLFTLPIAILLGLLCGGVAPRKGRVLLLAMTCCSPCGWEPEHLLSPVQDLPHSFLPD